MLADSLALRLKELELVVAEIKAGREIPTTFEAGVEGDQDLWDHQ
jgi:hypothetical protein